ncbi:metal ABC transporter permease [Thiocystis violascens]|uniref:ABC-type Mn2+/Zn2+ transport system, permease component n=1 Tax=Thiocystis violascens (strain ATCC 17096 / DSM 198 / 6111) TaxID=765911 RepID=I3YBT6_THIV6|nr:metal ABC transporter permease [Thiocystis violascens]AFL74454.1 ABC-type Mn2+/Zn2+ transport system, permease component [Thiocystis violascens DSM 198]
MFELIPDLALDPLFRLPFVTGLLLAGLLPVLGALLTLRQEWLAALGLAHLAAASALVGLAAGLPAVVGGILGALGAGAVKTLLRACGNAAYAFMILIGWSAMLLVAANSAVGDSLGHALIDGQLYFAGTTELLLSALLVASAIRLLPWLMPLILRATFFPRFETANRQPAWHWRLGLDLLTAASLAVGTATLGLMGTFALIFVPAWIAFRIAPSWRWTLILAVLIGGFAYLAAFLTALALDQPFGPVLVALLVAGAGLAALSGAGTASAT